MTVPTIPRAVRPILGLAVALLLLIVSKACYDDHIAGDAIRENKLNASYALERTQRRRADSIVILYRREQRRVATPIIRWRERTHALVASITLPIAPIPVRDSNVFAIAPRDSAPNDRVPTVPLVDPRPFVAELDSAAALLQQCTTLNTLADSVIAAREAELNTCHEIRVVEHAQRPGFFRRLGVPLKWVGVGAIIGAVMTR